MEIPLALAVVLAVLIIVAYWVVLLGAVWLGHKITVQALERRFGTSHPDAVLHLLADRIRNGPKR